MRNILFPIFNLGQAILVVIMVIIIILIAVYDDLLLAVYMGVPIYIVMVFYSYLRGLAPDEVEIYKHEIEPISALLATERFVYPINDRVWAPAMSRSSLFKSDWIWIKQIGDEKFILKGRKRDLRIILSEIR